MVHKIMFLFFDLLKWKDGVIHPLEAKWSLNVKDKYNEKIKIALSMRAKGQDIEVIARKLKFTRERIRQLLIMGAKQARATIR